MRLQLQTQTRSVSVRDRTVEAQQRMYKHFHPYSRKDGATPLELRFSARTIGPSSHNGMSMQDVVQVCCDDRFSR